MQLWGHFTADSLSAADTPTNWPVIKAYEPFPSTPSPSLSLPSMVNDYDYKSNNNNNNNNNSFNIDCKYGNNSSDSSPSYTSWSTITDCIDQWFATLYEWPSQSSPPKSIFPPLSSSIGMQFSTNFWNSIISEPKLTDNTLTFLTPAPPSPPLLALPPLSSLSLSQTVLPPYRRAIRKTYTEYEETDDRNNSRVDNIGDKSVANNESPIGFQSLVSSSSLSSQLDSYSVRSPTPIGTLPSSWNVKEDLANNWTVNRNYYNSDTSPLESYCWNLAAPPPPPSPPISPPKIISSIITMPAPPPPTASASPPPPPPQTIESSVYIQPRIRRRLPTLTECVFCKNNNRSEEIYKSHILKDPEDKIVCPYLRAYDCPICHNGGGIYAHTVRYCPMNRAGIKLKIESFLNDSDKHESQQQQQQQQQQRRHQQQQQKHQQQQQQNKASKSVVYNDSDCGGGRRRKGRYRRRINKQTFFKISV
ncbi:phospholipase D A-like [Oppia nitens]|uniref:phospholipase D A-like n=1 Tax=Oppia nitens TaxID=1686743 RepID=UPI0023DB0987|nr:phospholipase D A-like [Oppia nitens]